MKKIKTKKVIFFISKYSSETEPCTIISQPKQKSKMKFISYNSDIISPNFMNKKRAYFHIHKYDTEYFNLLKNKKEGRWTLKEHIQFLKAIDKFGMKWEKISSLIPTRTVTQIMSHSQKFYKKLKGFKDEELGIDFTARNITNVNDMIKIIKSVNKNYNIVTAFLYISERCSLNTNLKICDKENININDILCEDISKNIICDSKNYYDDAIKENTIDKEVKDTRYIINNGNDINNNFPINNISINNNNFLNSINHLDTLISTNLFNAISSNNVYNNISNQNIIYNSINIVNNNYINNDYINLLNKDSVYYYQNEN